MSNLIYENDAAILTFPYQEVVNLLGRQIKENNVEDDSKLLSRLQEYSVQGKKDVRVKNDNVERPEYLNGIIYIISDLLSEKKGEVFCKECRQAFSPVQIQIADPSPFDFQIWMDKKGLSCSGGPQISCPRTHQLLVPTDWLI